MTERSTQYDDRVTHAAVFLLLLAGCSLVPALRGWPWIWLAPFAAQWNRL
jgi:hypothetical protein